MRANITLRKYLNTDCEAASRLFYDTVHSVNAADYSAEQLDAWARGPNQLTAKREVLVEQLTLVAEIDGDIVGFGSIDQFGYLDLLYVHKDYQQQGIATVLCDELEKGFASVTTHASITARPFFEKRGYVVVKSQQVERFGVILKNFKMKKIS